MDLVFISKIIVIIIIYSLGRYFIKKTDWHFRGEREIWKNNASQKLYDKLKRFLNIDLNNLIIGFYVIFFGLPTMFTFSILGFSTLKSFDLIGQKTYFEQITFFVGLIGIYFYFLIKHDSQKFEANKKETLIKEYHQKILALEKELSKYE
jgi:hypothetical protein